MTDGKRQAFGLRLNAVIEQNMNVVTPVSLILGFLFTRWLRGYTGWVPYLFAYLTFVMALGCSFGQIRDTLKRPLPLLAVVLLAHAVAPPIAFAFGRLLFGAGSDFVVGLVLFAVIPLGVSSVIWVGLSKGNVAMSLSMIVLDSLLSPFVVPAELKFFFGAQVKFDLWSMMHDLLIIIVAPTILGVFLNYVSRGRAKPWSAPVALPTSKLSFIAVLLINAAAIAPDVVRMKAELPLLLPVVLVLVFVCYALGYAGALPFRDAATTVTMMYSSGMRNISLGLVLALSYFSTEATIPVVMSILIQQPLATVNHWLLDRLFMRRRRTPGTGEA